MIRQYELVEKMRSYDPGADEEALDRAYVFAMRAHGNAKRASGDPYFSHPLEVAGILTDYKLDTSTIITALLHDTVEDTPMTLEDIKGKFGADIAQLVDGVTKLTRLELQSNQTKQAENFRKFLLAMSEDIRVLLVKLADRLHNMRTLHHIKDADKRYRIALETMEIYAPLAARIGTQRIKNELEDLSFRELNPDAHSSIVKRLEFLRQQGGVDLINRVISELRQVLKKEGVTASVMGREKTPYSIWQKMQRKQVEFEQLSDIMAFRIAVDSPEDCYKALGVIHTRYRVIPQRFKDYISNPKPNGYQALHTGILGPQRERIEVQIMTHKMYEVADRGVAAHWQYKTGERVDGRKFRWLRELLDILEHASNPEEFLEHTKLEMFQDQVFCFTPAGELISLPSGATPVDFAYAVHSEIGDTCVGAKVNGRIVPLRTRLQNGDQVEIITSKAQTPSPTWEDFIVTGKARSRIRRFVRMQQRSEWIKLGTHMLEKEFATEGYEFSEKALDAVLPKFRVNKSDDLIAKVGSGELESRLVVETVFPGLKDADEKTTRSKRKGKGKKSAEVVSLQSKKNKKKGEKPVSIKGLTPGVAVHYARCCYPLPGDRIVGIRQKGKGLVIHTIDCESLESFDSDPDKWVDVSWLDGAEQTDAFTGRVKMVVSNVQGSLGQICTVIGKNRGNITNLKITERATDFFELIIDIEVENAKHLNNVIAALRATPAANSVERARG